MLKGSVIGNLGGDPPTADRRVGGVSWQRLAEEIELLHEVALDHGRASTEADRVRA